MKYALSNVFEDPFWLTTIPMALIGWIVALVGAILNNAQDSSQFPVFSWWGVAFEMVAIFLTVHAALSNEIRMYRLATLSCLCIATVYTTNSTNNFVWRSNSSSGAAAAGNILLSIINLVWVLYFGTTQDEPVHVYIDSFAGFKKMGAPSEFQRRLREKRRRRTTQSTQAPTTLSRRGTARQPYRMSDIVQNINIGGPSNFNRQTDMTNPSGVVPDLARSQSQAASNPLSSTYLYSVEQLHRHGLASHEVEDTPNEWNTQHQQVTEQPAQVPGQPAQVPGQVHPNQTEQVGQTGHELHEVELREDPEDDEMYDHGQPIARARARFSYNARTSEGEIPFVEGEILEVCDMTGNWWYCRRETGDEGLCPRNYLDLLDDHVV